MSVVPLTVQTHNLIIIILFKLKSNNKIFLMYSADVLELQLSNFSYQAVCMCVFAQNIGFFEQVFLQFVILPGSTSSGHLRYCIFYCDFIFCGQKLVLRVKSTKNSISMTDDTYNK